MSLHRRVHVAATLFSGCAAAAALTAYPRTAAILLAASMLLLIWSLERVRVLLNPRTESRR